MDEILRLLRSIDFWTIVSGVAAVLGLAITGIQIVKSRKTERHNRIAESVYRKVDEFETTARELMIAFESLSNKVQTGTQNDEEGQRLSVVINNGGLSLRTKGLEITNFPSGSTKDIEKLKSAVETVYQSVAAITKNKSGSLTTLHNAISELQKAKENVY